MIAVKKVVLSIDVCDEKVQETIVIVISPGAAVSGGGVINQAPLRKLFEGPISAVPIEEIFDASPIGLSVGHEKIEVPIIIKIGPCPAP